MAAVEQFANNPTATCNGALTNSQTNIPFTPVSGTFPGSPQFRIAIGPNPPAGQVFAPTEILLVTALPGGNNWTANRNDPGGGAGQTHANGDLIALVLTKESLLYAFARIDSANAAELVAQDFKATGVANLTSASAVRFVGRWTTAGAPAGLTGVAGDWGYDSNNVAWYCTAPGTPGTWTGAVGVGNAPALGSPLAGGRWIGNWTTVGAPTGLTAVIGDWGLDGNGNHWYCTAPGTPGTWNPRGAHQLGILSGVVGAGGYVLNSIPTGYRSLQLQICLRSTDATAGLVNHLIRLNNDATTANYRQQNQRTSSTVTVAPTENIGTAAGFNLTMYGGGVAAGFHSAGECWFWNYSATTTVFKVGQYHTVAPQLMTGSGNFEEEYSALVYQSAAATPISRIDIIPAATGFDADSYVMLIGYGA